MEGSDAPYVGPMPFAQTDARRFFGRSREISELTSLVIAHQAVLLYAASGTGKTSLVQAGLIPEITGETGEDTQCDVLPIVRLRDVPPAEIARLSPKNPYAFATAAAWTGKLSEPEAVLDRTLADLWQERERPTDPFGQPLLRLMIFDQFEEFFSLYPQFWEHRLPFIEEIAALLKADRFSRVLFVMREEYLAQFDDRYSTLLPNQLRVRLHLQRLGERQALQAVTKPLPPPRTFADGVAGELVRELRKERVEPLQPNGKTDEIVGEYVEPVQLQVVCQNLWDGLPPTVTEITHEHLQQYAQVDRALATFYEESVRAAIGDPPRTTEAALRHWFEDVVISPSLTRMTVHREPTATRGMPNEVLDALVDRHVLQREQRFNARWYELPHDRLIEPIRTSNADWFRKNPDTRETIRQQARLWALHGEDRGFLLTNQMLAEARRYMDEHPGQFSRVERDFVAASAASADRAAAERAKVRRTVAWSGAAAAVVFALLAVWALAERSNAEDQRSTAESERQIAVDARGTAELALATTDAQARRFQSRQLALEADAVVDSQPDLSLLLGLEALNRGDTIEARSTLFNGLLATPHLLASLPGYTGANTGVAFSPDGRIFAAAGSHRPGGEAPFLGDGGIYLWDVATRRPLRSPLAAPLVWSIAFSPDGSLLVSGNADGTVVFWDVATWEPLGPAVRAHTDAVWSLAFSPNGSILASGGSRGDKSVVLWDVAARAPRGEALRGHLSRVAALAFSPDGSVLASGSRDGTVRFWDVAAGTSVGEPLTIDGTAVRAVAYSPDGETLAVGGCAGGIDAETCDGGILQRWAVDSRQVLDTLSFEAVYAVAYNGDGQRLAAGLRDGAIVLWDAAGTEVARLVGHGDAIAALAYSGDGTTLGSGDWSGGVRLWNAEEPSPLSRVLSRTQGVPRSIAFDPDGTIVGSASCLDPSCVEIEVARWDVLTGEVAEPPRLVHVASTEGVEGMALSPDLATLAVAAGGRLSFYDVASDQQLRPPIAFGNSFSNRGSVRTGAFSQDGSTIAVGGDQCLRLVDGTQSCSGVVKFEDVAENKTSPDVTPAGAVVVIAFSGDGKRVAIGTITGEVVLVNVADGLLLGPPIAASATEIRSLALGPDGQILAWSAPPDAITLFDLPAQRSIGEFPETTTVQAIAVRRDGQVLATIAEDGTIVLWDLNPETWRQLACERANRNLSPEEWQRYLGDEPYRATCPDLPPGGGQAAASPAAA